MGLRPFVVFDCIVTWASDSGSEFICVLLGHSAQWRNWTRVDSDFWSVHCPSAVCHSPGYSNYVVDGFFVPSALSFQSSDFTRSEYTICVAFPMKHSALLFRMPSQIQNLYLGFILFIGSVEICVANTFSLNGTNPCVGFLPCSLSNGVFPTSGQMHFACCTNHGKISDSSPSDSCVLLPL